MVAIFGLGRGIEISQYLPIDRVVLIDPTR